MTEFIDPTEYWYEKDGYLIYRYRVVAEFEEPPKIKKDYYAWLLARYLERRIWGDKKDGESLEMSLEYALKKTLKELKKRLRLYVKFTGLKVYFKLSLTFVEAALLKEVYEEAKRIRKAIMDYRHSKKELGEWTDNDLMGYWCEKEWKEEQK